MYAMYTILLQSYKKKKKIRNISIFAQFENDATTITKLIGSIAVDIFSKERTVMQIYNIHTICR